MNIQSKNDRIAGVCFCLVLMAMGRADACPICLTFPTRTTADNVIASESIVFARESPDKPFAYRPLEVLKGAEISGDVDLFVNSSARRRLRANPAFRAVLVRRDIDTPWKSLGIADEEFQAVIRRILLFSSQWSEYDDRTYRHDFFLSLFGHKNHAISELAYLEIGRAPYSTIKRLGRTISHESIRPMLRRREYIQWRPLAILLLAQSAKEQDHQLIENAFHDCQRFSLTTNLSAWSTAYIELHKLGAVNAIEKIYLGDARRTEAEIRAVIAALSIHGQYGHIQLRENIARSYGTALQFHPSVAGVIAKDLAAWQKNDYRADILRIVAQSEIMFSTQDSVAIKRYLK